MRNILQALPENSIVPLVESFLNSRNQGDQTPAPILARAPVMDDLDIRLVDLDLGALLLSSLVTVGFNGLHRYASSSHHTKLL